jgi:hypothetical protein
MNKTNAVAVRIHAVSPGFISDDRAAGDRIAMRAIKQ